MTQQLERPSIGHREVLADRRNVEVDVELPADAHLPGFVEAVSELEDVFEVQWNE